MLVKNNFIKHSAIHNHILYTSKLKYQHTDGFMKRVCSVYTIYLSLCTKSAERTLSRDPKLLTVFRQNALHLSEKLTMLKIILSVVHLHKTPPTHSQVLLLPHFDHKYAHSWKESCLYVYTLKCDLPPPSTSGSIHPHPTSGLMDNTNSP